MRDHLSSAVTAPEPGAVWPSHGAPDAIRRRRDLATSLALPGA